jgi:hypothetical protein
LRERVKPMRSLAEAMTGIETQAMMRRLPGDYDLLAKSANEYVQPKWSNSLEMARVRKRPHIISSHK